MSKTKGSFIGLWDHGTRSLLWSIPSNKFDSIIHIFTRYADNPKIRPVFVTYDKIPGWLVKRQVFGYLSGSIIDCSFTKNPYPSVYKCFLTYDYYKYAKTHNIPIVNRIYAWNATLDSMVRLIGDIQRVGDDYYSQGKPIALRIGG